LKNFSVKDIKKAQTKSLHKIFSVNKKRDTKAESTLKSRI